MNNMLGKFLENENNDLENAPDHHDVTEISTQLTDIDIYFNDNEIFCGYTDYGNYASCSASPRTMPTWCCVILAIVVILSAHYFENYSYKLYDIVVYEIKLYNLIMIIFILSMLKITSIMKLCENLLCVDLLRLTWCWTTSSTPPSASTTAVSSRPTTCTSNSRTEPDATNLISLKNGKINALDARTATESLGRCVFSNGRHSGMCFSDVFEQHPSYHDWLITRTDSVSAVYRLFIGYCALRRSVTVRN